MNMNTDEFIILKAALKDPRGEVGIDPHGRTTQGMIAWDLQKKGYLQNSGDIFYITEKEKRST